MSSLKQQGSDFMLFDWFTVMAQIFNFLLLVWLMKRFLYKPILIAIEARENDIVAKLEDADKKKEEARKESQEFEKKNSDFEDNRVILMKKMIDEIDVERQRLLDEVKNEASSYRLKQKSAREREVKNLNQMIKQRTQSEIFAITRKVLSDLASISLEERIVDVFISRLKELDKNEKDSVGEILKSSHESPIIRSFFDFEDLQSQQIQKWFNETFSSNLKIKFEKGSDLVTGVELIIEGMKWSWSVDDYLTSLEKSIDELFQEKSPVGKNNEENNNKN